MRTNPLVALFAGLGLVATLPSLACAQVLETVRVPMRDGVELATDIWRPSVDDGPRPVLLRRTPYGRVLDAGFVSAAVSLGYVLVSQDVRGRGDSAGTFSPFRDDAHDGSDTIVWVAAQPWANGRVGTLGGSAEGIVQLLAAGEAPEALRCVHATVATDDLYEALYLGGAWRTELGTAWLEGLGEPEALAEFRAHEVSDSYWAPARLDDAERARVRAAVMLVGGVHDVFALGTPRTFRELQDAAPESERERRFLVLGPWTHGGVGMSTQGEIAYPADAAYGAAVAELVAFFDWCLKDGPRPSWTPVRYYVARLGDDGRTATGAWREATSWPPPAAAIELRLHADGALRARAPDEDGAAASLAVDPADPVPSAGGGNLTTPAGPFDQRSIDLRDDVLVVSTPPAVEAVEVIGDARARIYAASATSDVDVIVRLEQLTPSGRAILLADGVRRGRFVQGSDAIRPLEPGQPALFEVELGPVALELAPGHALRVAIAGTSSPRFEPNPGVAEPIATAAPGPTRLTIFRDSSYPSAIELPIARGTPPGADDAPTLDAGARLDAGTAPGTSVAGCGCGIASPSRHRGASTALASLLALLVVRRRRSALR